MMRILRGKTASWAFKENAVLLTPTDHLTRVTGGAFTGTADGKKVWGFAALTIPSGFITSGGRVRFESGTTDANALRIRENNTAVIITSWWYDTTGARIVQHTATTTAGNGDRLAILYSLDTDVDSKIAYKINAGSWTTSTNSGVASETIDLTGAITSAYRRQNITTISSVAVYRTMEVLTGSPTLPDITTAAVQNNFVNADGSLVNPAASQGAYGPFTMDTYGDASAWNAGTNHGNGGAWEVAGTIVNA